MTSSRKIFGVGLNDAVYPIREGKYVNDKVVYQWVCPFYQTWVNMLSRCYSSSQKILTPTYSGVTVCEDWKTFTKFKSWMELQNWEGRQLDKDLFGDGTHYSPETCCFLSQQMNLLVKDYHNGKGVSKYKNTEKWRAYCQNKHLGIYETKEEALVVAKTARQKFYLAKLAEVEEPDFIKNKFMSKL